MVTGGVLMAKKLRFREMDADRLRKKFEAANENCEALKKADRISYKCLKSRINI